MQVVNQHAEQNLAALENVASDPVTVYLNGLAPSGRRSMRSLLGQVAAILGFEKPLEQMPWAELRYAHVAKVRAELRSQGKSPNSVNTALAAVRGVLRAALHLGQFPSDEWVRIGAVKRVRGERLAGRGLSRREVSSLLAACSRDKSIGGIRDVAIIALTVTAGLRRSEIVGLQVGDYETRTGTLLVRVAKGGQQREQVLTNATRKKVTAWLRKRSKEAGPLFCPVGNDCAVQIRPLSAQTIYDVVGKRASQARIDSCSPHDLRRTFVTRLLRQHDGRLLVFVAFLVEASSWHLPRIFARLSWIL
jgi:integrase/recombinase XerD